MRKTAFYQEVGIQQSDGCGEWASSDDEIELPGKLWMDQHPFSFLTSVRIGNLCKNEGFAQKLFQVFVNFMYSSLFCLAGSVEQQTQPVKAQALSAHKMKTRCAGDH